MAAMVGFSALVKKNVLRYICGEEQGLPVIFKFRLCGPGSCQ